MLGKLSGAVIGFLLGVAFAHQGLMLLLAGLGALLGHLLIDREPEASTRPPRPPDPIPPLRPSAGRRPVGRPGPARPSEELAHALCPIFVEVARVDGEVNQAEIRVVKQFFETRLQFAGQELEVLRLALKEAIVAPAADLGALLKEVRTHVKPSDRLLAVDALYEMALADGELSRAESDALKRVVNFFNLSEEQLRQITAQQLGSGDEQYQALGLTAASSDEEIKAAFRRLAATHHPDRVASKGPREAEQAAENFRRIKDAYEDLKKLRGL